LKILHVIASVDPRGGGPLAGVLSSSEVWFEHGHERHVLSLDPPDATWVAETPVPVFALGIASKCYATLHKRIPLLRYGYTPHLTDWLRRYAENYDAVIINGLWNYASFGSWRALRKSKVPYFVFPHGMLDPWFNTAYPIKTLFKSIYWKLMENRVIRDARGVLFTCEEEKILARQSFAPYSAREFVVGYGARDIGGDAERQRQAFFSLVPTARDKQIILFLSRIHEKKGVDLLIEAFASVALDFPTFDLVIAGPDQVGLQAGLIGRTTKLGIAKRVHWPGMLTGDAKWGAYLASEFFALPSHQENFGIAVVEAMALARPVMITNKVNIWREIERDNAGIVVNDDIQHIAYGLRKMLMLQKEQRAIIGSNGRKSFLAQYDLANNAMHLLKLIQQGVAPES
jgi:glycosyltransferase involved in cell wall biosynthesis